MPTAIVIGGSIAGLASALMLDDLGYSVRLLERDPRPTPASVVEAASRRRPSVPQSLHSHVLCSLGTNLLADRLPQVYAALVAEGAHELQLGRVLPPTLDDRTPRPADADLNMLCCRRSTMELVFAREAESRPAISFERGVTVRGLVVDDGARSNISGVSLADGRAIRGDLVVNAAGRRSPVRDWLAEHGIPVAPDETEPARLTYFTRFYRLRAAGLPGPCNRGYGAGGIWDHYSAVLFLADNHTFSISLGVLPKDRDLNALRTNAGFTAAARVSPFLGPWLEMSASEPISDVAVMAGLDNRMHGVATSQQPPVPGLLHVGDAVGTTNPAYGRGISLALQQIFGLSEVLAQHPVVSREQAVAAAELTERCFRPWYELSVRNDRERAELWRGTINGQDVPGHEDLTLAAAFAAAATDSVVWRRVARLMMSLDQPSSVFDDEDIRSRVAKALAGMEPMVRPPSRAELLRVVSEADR